MLSKDEIFKKLSEQIQNEWFELHNNFDNIKIDAISDKNNSCSARFGMYKQSKLAGFSENPIFENTPALTNEDRFIQHVIKEYEEKGRI